MHFRDTDRTRRTNPPAWVVCRAPGCIPDTIARTTETAQGLSRAVQEGYHPLMGHLLHHHRYVLPPRYVLHLWSAASALSAAVSELHNRQVQLASAVLQVASAHHTAPVFAAASVVVVAVESASRGVSSSYR